jgi:pilus assembly protein TadC
MSTGLLHGLGTAVSAVAAAVCTAETAALARREAAVRRRTRRLLGGGDRPGTSRRAAKECAQALRGWAPLVGVGLGVAVLVGGLAGCVAGPATAYGLHRWHGRARRTIRVRPVDDRRLPLAADLMAACLAAGAGPCEAADAVGSSLGGQLGAALTQVASELRLGGDPPGCWGRFRPPELGRCLARAATTGVPPVEEVTRLAAAERARDRREALCRARRAGVLATAPLGLCFLPAFLLVGVAPVVMGLAEAVLSSGAG